MKPDIILEPLKGNICIVQSQSLTNCMKRYVVNLMQLQNCGAEWFLAAAQFSDVLHFAGMAVGSANHIRITASHMLQDHTRTFSLFLAAFLPPRTNSTCCIFWLAFLFLASSGIQLVLDTRATRQLRFVQVKEPLSDSWFRGLIVILC